MPRAVKSAKGELVDFDLLKIKAQIAAAPKPTSVQTRENFIDQKFKRRLKKLKSSVAQQVQVSEVLVEPTLPDTQEDDTTEE